MREEEFKICVEISREWDGDKVANELIEKIKKNISLPKFILLFTTIHYKKEFKKILGGIRSNFPDTPLIGGTVAGFMTNEGSYTRGVTVLAVDYSNIKVNIGIGHDTKKNPEKAALEFIKMITDNKSYLDLTEKFLFILISGTRYKQDKRIGKN